MARPRCAHMADPGGQSECRDDPDAERETDAPTGEGEPQRDHVEVQEEAA
jgi:hypothetical protein